jgi:hypothetical protein
MKLAIFAGLALAFTTAAALAGDQFAGMYGNTLVIKDTDGTTSRVYINADKTWEQRMADGKTARGTYSWKDETHFCIVVVEPPAKPGEQAHTECHEISGDHKVGDTWTMTGNDGKPTELSIVAGRQ